MSELRQAEISVGEIRETVADQLKIAVESISDDDDLVRLGLDSIRTMKLAGHWRRCGHAVEFAQLVSQPTVAGWCRLLRAAAPMAAQAAEETAPEDLGGGAGDTVVPDSECEPFALAPMQHAYWIGRSEEQELGGVAAHLYVEFDGGPVDCSRLQEATRDLVAHHPMLRTKVLPDGTQQTMAQPVVPVFSLLDLRDGSGSEILDGLERVRLRMTHQRMAIAEGQVIEVVLTLLPWRRSRLHVDLDMIAADAMSYRILLDDLARLYRGGALPEQTYSYRQYRTEHTGDRAAHERDRQWWQRRLDRLPDAPQLPTIPVASRREPNRTVRYHHWLAPADKHRLLAAAHEHGVTPAMTVAAIFAETIGGWSSASRFLLNVPLFHRDPVHPGVDRILGDFSSSIVLAVDLTAPATVAQRARQLQQTMRESAAHSAYSGLEVLRDLGRYRSAPVLAPVVFTSALNLGELFSETVKNTFGQPGWIVSQGPQVLLDAQVTEVDGGLLLNWDVRADAFRAGVIDAMFAHYTAAIDQLAREDGNWDIDATPGVPREQALVRTQAEVTDGRIGERCLHQGFFHYAAQMPDTPAVVWTTDDLDGCWTYWDLRQQALAVAGALADRGVRPGDSVAVWLPKGPDQIVAVLGILAIGATYVPIGFDQPEVRRARIIGTGQVVCAVVGDEGDIGSGIECVRLTAARRFRRPLAVPVYLGAAAVAYVVFTSGSTGVPKGVEVSHSAAMNTIDALNSWFAVNAADRALALSALEFDLSVYDVFGMLSVGGCVVAIDSYQRDEATCWVELLRRHRVSILNCVPAVFDMLLRLGGEQLGDSLRAVALGGDWVGADLARRLAQQVPGCRFAGLGGATETAIHSTICELDDVPPDWVTVPYGKPLRNVRCRVVSGGGRDCPDWVPGELWVGGAGVAVGYRGEQRLTAEKFIEYQGKRWYRTGDRARWWPDGTLEFLGRADHQVQVRGYRVELGEVEAALCSVPGIRQAVAVLTGEQAPKLVAGVAGTGVTQQGLIAAVADILPDYMVPSRVEIVDQLPLTSNGKLDRRTVAAELAAAPAVSADRQPRTAFERALVEIVRDVLGLEDVGVGDDFFGIGGDSVSATSVIARLRGWLHIEHAVVADIFAARTVAALAQRLVVREGYPDRVEQIAAIFLEVDATSDAEVLAQLATLNK